MKLDRVWTPALVLLLVSGGAAVALIRESTIGSPAAILVGFDLARPVARWELPRTLSEVSGLAVTASGTVLAHGDEDAVVVELDYLRGTRLRTIQIGRPAVRGDFEGIALSGHRITLMTSDGRLVSADLPETVGDIVVEPVSVLDSGLGRLCELEGLDTDGAGAFLLPCKSPRSRGTRTGMTVWRWSAAGGVEGVVHLSPGPGKAVAQGHASAIARSEQGSLVVLFGMEQTMAEYSSTGTLLAARKLDARRHPQPEGFAVTNSWLLVADEAAGRVKRGTITVYGHTN